MSDQCLPTPTLAQLKAADPQGFVLQISDERGLKVELLDLRERVAISAEHECYSLQLLLPAEVKLPQAVFNLFVDGLAQPWPLLMAPLRPEPDGRHVLEAIVHYKRQVEPRAAI